MKKEKSLSPKDWWICEGEFCNNPLAKIIKGKIGFPEVLEILGTGGQQFTVRPKYIRLSCVKCGQTNDIISGESFSDEWKKNFKLMQEDTDFTDDDDDNFYTNQYLRNLLLARLNPMQKKAFQYMQKHADGEWSFEDMAKELKITEESAHKLCGVIYLAQGDISANESLKTAAKIMEESKKFRSFRTEH